MELPESPSSHQFSTRKPGESGLAEWAQKIRALQRQVDEDEEEEHRKLEQEIAASRLARVRRSAGYARAPLYPVAVPSDTPSTTSRRSDALEFARSSTGRRGEKAEALQKPVGKSFPRPQTAPQSPGPTSLATLIGGRAMAPRSNKHAPQLDATDPTLFEPRSTNSTHPHPVFGRGGIAMPGLTSRGYGIVSPIQNHEIRSSTPTASIHAHSITTHRPASSNVEPVAVSNSHNCSGETSRQPRTSTPSAALKRYVQHVGQVVSTQVNKPSFGSDTPRPRTVSTPTDIHPTRATTLPPPVLQSQSRPTSPHARTPRGPNFGARTPPPAIDGDYPLTKPPTPPSSNSSTPAFIAHKKSTITNAPSPAFSVKLPTFSVSTPSLPRPEASIPKTTPQSRTPSLHPPKEKDPTPSISRLKGRGFVQSMVKASSALEAAVAGSVIPEVGKPGPAKNSPSIASRWKPEPSFSSSSLPTTTPISTNFRKSWTSAAASPSTQRTAAQRKSWTTTGPLKIEDSERDFPARLDQQSPSHSVRLVVSHHTGRSVHAVEQEHTEESSQVLGPQNTERSTRKAHSPPSLSTPSRSSTPPPASPGGHGLGSSSTMFSYIKPMKTGDDPATGHSRPHSRPTTPHSHVSANGPTSTQDVDELDHCTVVSSGSQQGNGLVGFPAPSGRPLVHLTTERPKPKKANRKKTGDQLAETRGISCAPHVPTPELLAQSVMTQAATPTPSPTRITPPSPRVPGTSHSDMSKQLNPHPPISKPDRSSANATNPWNGQALIGVRSSDSSSLKSREKPFLVGLSHPLPDLSIPSPSPPKSSHGQPSSASPRSPRREGRIPSTGSRTLVMDIAQALQVHASIAEAETTTKSPVPFVALPIEERKSSFDKYSGRVMSPVVEERTSTTRVVNAVHTEVDMNADASGQEQASSDSILPVQQDGSFIEIPFHDEPLPRIDLDNLLPPFKYQHGTDITTISVDIMSITGATATGVKGDANIFYDSEILAIVHRAKMKSSGLVETTLWGWEGRRSQIGEREQRKLKDMARHYGTKLYPVQQGCEPPELMHTLGGRLATRQGTRSYWSAENTTMHQVRLAHGNVFIDEHDLHVSNLCSAFSYCLTLLGTSYVWYGKGSPPGERQAALGYALSLTAESSPVVLVEQESDDNEMFWMMLGDADYARADYWRWRPDLTTALPRIWRVDALSAPHFIAVPAFSTQSNIDLSVYLLDCIWELFVIVGTKARKARRDIRLALSIARDLSSRIAASRPFTPPIHVLVLPSKIPLDLRLHFRDLDEELVNGMFQPDHMNLLELSEALSDLEKVRWEKKRLKDPTMLPLGIDPTSLP
ncbi:hypothetical protein BJV74DRAFT_844539 [Russula compacta]|nr:hypothetical protein BJV74DRAFT_844539 [Russula compacta]